MISTLHGNLPLTIQPNAELAVSLNSAQAYICTVRGIALNRHVNVRVTLNVDTGELLLFSPEAMVGAFRLGDLIAAQLAHQAARAQLPPPATAEPHQVEATNAA